ncbi:MAG: MBOAT family protein [Erysipelotrichaceae bacterium]|nr:MBOAT family protein [Erysipelotrichaceae bacterium]MBQ3412457.1 MBOAT family protein [Oscillospiraceae bacterium]
MDITLPIGISFYTFQAIGYVLDVFRETTSAEHNLGYYAVFMSFFPQLTSGPIARAGDLLPQIKSYPEFDYKKATYGLKQMAWGYFKKIVIADTISQFTGKVLNDPSRFHGFALLLAAFQYSIQIYCDFSGYSDVACGTAKLFGIELTVNFRSPYYSQSIREFWNRWHISLSTWLRDYIYIPLGGNRKGNVRRNINLLITFLISGLWHGASWTYVLWGLVHGLAQIVENYILPKKKDKSSRGGLWFLRVVFVFFFCTLTWVLFSAHSFNDALYFFTHLADGISSPVTYLHDGFTDLGFGKQAFAFMLPSMLLLMLFDYFNTKEDVINRISGMRTSVRWIIYISFILWMLISVPVRTSSEFIYFQF